MRQSSASPASAPPHTASILSAIAFSSPEAFLPAGTPRDDRQHRFLLFSFIFYRQKTHCLSLPARVRASYNNKKTKASNQIVLNRTTMVDTNRSPFPGQNKSNQSAGVTRFPRLTCKVPPRQEETRTAFHARGCGLRRREVSLSLVFSASFRRGV